MKQKCYIMGAAVLALLCVMCSGRQAEAAAQRMELFVNCVMQKLEPFFAEAAQTGAGTVGADRADADLREPRKNAGAGAEMDEPKAGDGSLRYCMLDVPQIMQMPELPTGCEATALAMALAYEGVEIDKTEIAADYLIYNFEDDNMALGYVGDPFSEEGAGCFAPVIQKTAEKVLEAKKVQGRAEDISGTPFDSLLTYVLSEKPVIVWTTMYMGAPEFTEDVAVGRYRGRQYRWYRQEHCVVLTGCDMEARTVQVNDPLEGIVHRDLDAFRNIYNETGQNAVVLYITKEMQFKNF